MIRKKEKKSHWLRNFILYCLIAAGIWYFGTYTLKTAQTVIKSDQIRDPVTIVQLSDLHGFTFGENNRNLIQAVRHADPDFIVATGDMYTAGDRKGQDTAVALLSDLAALYPVYSVHGEHDNDRSYEARLAEAGVDVLDYESRDITVGETSLRLYGINNVYYSDTFDLANAFTLDRSRYNILAAHITNFDAFASFGMDLSLCGDTHGGQVRLPFLGGLNNRGQWFPEKQEGEVRYVKGLYEKGASRLFVSAGLGSYPVPVRLLNRPEVAVIRLQGE